MPTHKMITIDGVRVRGEDEDRYRARMAPGAGTGALTRAQASPQRSTDGPFDPTAKGVGVDDVLSYLATADEAETTRVLDAEAAGASPRKGLLDRREQLIEQARERATGGGA